MNNLFAIYLKVCPFCGHHHLIRWGFYKRQWLPFEGLVKIQRLRCTLCLGSINVLPSFLLPHSGYCVHALKTLITTFMNHHDIWKESPEIEMDMSTAYRWRRLFAAQALQSLPAMRQALLEIKPSQPIRGPSDGQPITLKIFFKRYLRIAKWLARAAVRLTEGKGYKNPDLFCFLNHFLWQKTGKGLLMR